MLDAPAQSLLADDRPGVLGTLAGRFLHLAYRLSGKARYDDFRLEHVADLAILVIPGVANPKLLRTGAFFAEQIDVRPLSPGAAVLDMGTGSGVCALTAARRARRVVAVDVSPAAVRCARINVLLNRLEERIDVREGDLFAPLAGERFDLVLFNPPFLVGAPKDHRDAATSFSRSSGGCHPGCASSGFGSGSAPIALAAILSAALRYFSISTDVRLRLADDCGTSRKAPRSRNSRQAFWGCHRGPTRYKVSVSTGSAGARFATSGRARCRS